MDVLLALVIVAVCAGIIIELIKRDIGIW